MAANASGGMACGPPTATNDPHSSPATSPADSSSVLLIYRMKAYMRPGSGVPTPPAAVRIGGHQRPGQGLDHVPEQVPAGLGKLLSHPAGQVDTRAGLRSSHNSLSKRSCKGLIQDHAVAVSRYGATHVNEEIAPPLHWT